MEKSAKSSKNSKVYSANELCNIIKTCNKNGVTNIKISGIEIDFMNQGTDSTSLEKTWTPPKQFVSKNGDKHPLQALELSDEDLAELREIEKAQQAIDDPIGFENDIIKEFIDGEVDAEANGYSQAQ